MSAGEEQRQAVDGVRAEIQRRAEAAPSPSPEVIAAIRQLLFRRVSPPAVQSISVGRPPRHQGTNRAA